MVNHSFVRMGIVIAFLVGATARPATAEVISIVGGTFVFVVGGGAQLDIFGTRGFRLQAGPGTGRFDAIDLCRLPECGPGTVVDLSARWSGNDLTGTAILRGTTYEDLGGLDSPNSADIRFAGQVTMPPITDGPVSITVPFEFAGRFRFAEMGQLPQDALLTGGGLVTLSLEPLPADPNSWTIKSVVFEFSPVQRQ